MSLRIIHTGDLHIGQKLLNVCRLEEHRAMLYWISSQIKETDASVLLIAGDVFDKANPSAESQRLFFDWLADLQKIECLKQVVITAGNHDSAAYLQAFNQLFSYLEIHVVGADHNQDSSWIEDWVIPLKGDSGEYEGVVAAVPFLFEYRFGLKNKQMITSDIAAEEAFKTSLKKLYADLAEHAQTQYPGLPVVAMGHLTAIGEDSLVGPQPIEIHRILNNSLDGKLFDLRYSYVALGHIHKNYRVKGPSNAWYCGSPIPCSIDEAEDKCTRGVWLVELKPEDAYNISKAPSPKLLEAPHLRTLIRLRGVKDSIYRQIDELDLEASPFTTMVWIDAELPIYELNFLPDLREYVADRDIRIVGYRTKPISAKIGSNEDILLNDSEVEQDDLLSEADGLFENFDLSSLFVEFLKASEEEDPDDELLNRLIMIASDADQDGGLSEALDANEQSTNNPAEV
ncbi:MAG: hypothetical protein CMK59_02635 [Proteobacteria bacterium]|nr:hypothetical protein [Pseudomonadota bacterium]